MKKILVFILLLVGLFSQAQVLQYDNTYGREMNRLYVRTLFGMPKDTFAVPASLQSIPFIANKAGTIYTWNISTLVWNAFSGGSGSTETASNGLVKIVNDIQWGQTIAAAGDPALISVDREIPFNSDSRFFKFKSGSNEVRIIPAGQISIYNPAGGSIAYHTDGATAVPGYSYRFGTIASNVTQMTGGMVWTPSTKYFNIADLKAAGSLEGVDIEIASARTVSWRTNGDASIGQLGTKRTSFGITQPAAGAIGATVDITGTFRVTDSVTATSMLTITDTTGFDLVMRNRSTGLFKKMSSDIIGGGGSSTFIGLTDVPASYTGQTLKSVRVNAGETALEFFTPAGGGNVSNTGTPVNNQVAVWTDALTVEGDADLLFNGTQLGIQGTPGFALDIWNGGVPSILVGADVALSTRTNSTTKVGTIGFAPYTNTEESFGIRSVSTSASHGINIGIGLTGLNAATDISLYTGVYNSVTSVRKLLVTSTLFHINDPQANADTRIDGDIAANVFFVEGNGAGGGGGVGIYTATPTSYLHIGAGTATASTAPLKLTSGTNLTTAEAGAFEYNGTNLFFTRSGTTRESIITANAVNVVSPTTPNRTITVVIDGTTYYISAKTTND